jgi:hypothetical protein
VESRCDELTSLILEVEDDASQPLERSGVTWPVRACVNAMASRIHRSLGYAASVLDAQPSAVRPPATFVLCDLGGWLH